GRIYMKPISEYNYRTRSLIICFILLSLSLSVICSSNDVFAKVLNVRDFGAVGDGHHDDTAALQKAIEAAGLKKGGGVLEIPAGNYRITHTLEFKHLTGLIIRGEGMDFGSAMRP